jgi:broad specificity phosphatase PhoE
MFRAYVARHGETNWNRAGRYQGRMDTSRLTELGLTQAEALARELTGRHITRIVSSPLRRCVETAMPLAQRLGCSIEVDERLIEIGHGGWEGRLRSEIERDDPDRLRLWQSHPELVEFAGGESLERVRERWRRFAQSLDEKHTVAIITHDVLVRLAILDARNDALATFWQPRVVNGGFAQFEVRGRAWRLLDECVDAHLAGRIADHRLQAL